MKKNELVLYGSVGASWWGEEHFTASGVREALAEASGPLTVRLNSGGGVAAEGQAIYTILSEYPDEVTIHIDGAAASAASLIAMAGDRIVMRDGSFMLIHDPAQPWAANRGTEDDHRKTADHLAVLAAGYARVYARRAGIDLAEARKIMRDETTFDAQAAVAAGFATEAEAEPALQAAAFDYRIYANAPEAARKASESLGTPPAREAVMAMFAGSHRTTAKEAVMADKSTVAEETPVAKTDPTKEVTMKHDPKPEPVDMTAERARARRITELFSQSGLDMAVAAEMIADGTTLEAAADRVIEMKRKAAGDDLPRAGALTVRILRDERETRQVGMTMALTAQLAKANPETDQAREWMQKGVVDMAAEVIGHRGGLRSAADREEVVRMAMHTTSDFPIILENALNKRMADSYAKAQPTYQQVAERIDFNDFRPHPIAGIGDFPGLQAVSESGEIKFGTVGEKKETVTLAAYGIGLSISRQMLVNDDLSAIDRIIRGRGTSVALWEDATFWSTFLSGSNADGPTLTETSRQVFNTTDGTKAGSAAAIDVTSLSLGRAAMRKQKGIASAAGKGDGQNLNVNASILLVGPDKETQAQQVVAPIQASQATNVNPFSGTLQIIVTPYITGNAWYLLAAPSMQANFMYGFLNGASGPRLRMDEPFGVQGIRYSVERDFGCGATDFRFGYKNAGA